MGHNIFGERFIGRRQPAWHGLGTVFDEPLGIGAVEAIERARLDYTIHKVPLSYTFAGATVQADQMALVREATPDDPAAALLAVVSPSYDFLQNRELAELIDRELTAFMPVETAGALGKGETFFLTLDAGMGEVVPGEDIHHYFLITDSRTGTASLQFAYTPVRVVCQNTLVSGLSGATVKWSVGHQNGHRKGVETDVHLIAALHVAQAKLAEQMRRMAETHIADEHVDRLLAAVYPEPKPTAFVQRARSLEEFGIKLDAPAQETLDRRLEDAATYARHARMQREGARTLYDKFNDEYPNVAETAWAVYNAVVECEDYRTGQGDVDRACLFGERAKRKADAFRLAVALAN
jgi:phage/plasmid-like protein (TIGR03299 family)